LRILKGPWKSISSCSSSPFSENSGSPSRPVVSAPSLSDGLAFLETMPFSLLYANTVPGHSTRKPYIKSIP
jgi:hypothetical protein